MEMNALGRALLNNRFRIAAQRRWLVPAWTRMAGSLQGDRVLEIGCGQGAGAELLLDAMGASTVDAIDLDPVMVDLARKRVGHRCSVRQGDMTAIPAEVGAYDAVVDFGALHLVPAWRDAVAEVARVLRPGGRFLFEEIACPPGRATMPLATGRRIPGGFVTQRFLDHVVEAGLRVESLWRPWHLVASGMIGDLVGVAVKPGGSGEAG